MILTDKFKKFKTKQNKNIFMNSNKYEGHYYFFLEKKWKSIPVDPVLIHPIQRGHLSSKSQ